ncbi:MAG: elongation factor P [Planctomycetes bacterium]|nr:elongation factor P [Planctomycetota bacterium]HON44768.1 elongation factor P [Planctomycetota bacterium]HRU51002.1 elongation factor P [Planctomycetota bacterium]
MISSNDLKNGMTIIFNDVIHEVVEFQHIKPGKGHAFVRTKLKNLKTNAIFENTYRAKEPIEQAIVDKRNLQYLYRDRDLFYFQDPDTYDQIPIDIHIIEPLLDYLKEEDMVFFRFYEGEVVEAVLPDFIVLRVTEALPGLKGDTVQGGTKPVTLETGKVIQVPLFINQDDLVKVDTRTGRYIERVRE